MLLQLLLLISFPVFYCEPYGDCSGCKFYKHLHRPDSLERLKPLCGHRYSIQESVRNQFSYVFGICVSAGRQKDDVGAIQTEKQNKSEPVILGRTSMTDLMGGNTWLKLEYEGGDGYPNSCSKTARKATLMITCDPTVKEGDVRLRFIEENNNKSGDCYYLFQLDHPAVCSLAPTPVSISYFSAGSVFCIIFFSVVITYLIGGFFFQRFVRKARGTDQIPNVGFWKELGDLMADGCDLVCRCGRGRDGFSNDRRKSERLLENASDRAEIDDGLLGM